MNQVFNPRLTRLTGLSRHSRVLVVGALSATLALSACSTGAVNQAAKGSKESAAKAGTAVSSVAAKAGTAPAPTRPTAAELNAILAKATDPTVPLPEKIATVQGGQTAPELFDTMAKSKAESGAKFLVQDPVLPGYTPDSVLSTVSLQIPNRPPQNAENVEFIYENGTWKLSQSWACTLISNTVTPDKVPAMCNAVAPKPNK